MAVEKPEDFYKVYAAFKRYQTPVLKDKHVKWYDREFWVPARCGPGTSVLEIGSGTGEFLSYLNHKGVTRFHGVEQDSEAVRVMEPGLAAHVTFGDLWDYLDGAGTREPFDRVVMLDVLEHFPAAEGVRLLMKI